MPHLLRTPGRAIRKPPMLILLHGAGGSEKEIYNITGDLDERFLVVTVRGPFMQSPRHYLWFGVDALHGEYAMNLIQAAFSRHALVKFIHEAVDAYKVNATQVYVLGFDQGAVMALSLALTAPEMLAGIVCLSGRLPTEMNALMVKPKQLRGFPALVIHGTQDEIFPIAQGQHIRDTLKAYKFQLDYREYPSGHDLPPESLEDANSWLGNRLDSANIGGTLNPTPYRVQLGHVQIKVRNLERSIRFYSQFLGMKVVERTGRAYAFLSSNDSHHELALQNVGPSALIPRPNSIGMQNIGFQVADQFSFARAYKTLMDAGISVTAIDHMVRWSLYFHDPDGNEVEIYCDTRHWPGKADYWQGRDLPLDPETILEALKNK